MRVTIFRRGKTWWARFRHQGVQIRRSLETENRKVARDLADGIEREHLLHPETRSPAERTVADFLEEYRTFCLATKRPKTVANDRLRLKEFVETLRVVNLGQVCAVDVSSFLSTKVLRDGIKPTTVLRYREILHAFFERAKRLGYLRENPVAAVPRPRLAEREPRFLQLEEIDVLLKAVEDDQIAPLVAVLIFAGLRREEVCWLTWSDVELKGTPPVIRVRSKTVNEESWVPKTKRNRVVPISTRLRAALSDVRQRKDVPWFLPSPQGRRWDPDNLSARFRTLMERAGLPWNFLDLRHTFGSHLARRGVSLLKISKLMGNSPEIARRHYINLVPEELACDVEF